MTSPNFRATLAVISADSDSNDHMAIRARLILIKGSKVSAARLLKMRIQAEVEQELEKQTCNTQCRQERKEQFWGRLNAITEHSDSRDYDFIRHPITPKEERRGDWNHNFYLAVQGMSAADVDEVFRARQHGFEPEFN